MSPRLRTAARPVAGPHLPTPAPPRAGAPLVPLLLPVALTAVAALGALGALVRALLQPEPAAGPFARDAASPR